MTISVQSAYDGIDAGIHSLMSQYTSSADFTNALISNLSAANVDSAVLQYVQTPGLAHILDNTIYANPDKAVENVLLGLGANISDKIGTASKDFGVALVNTTKTWTQNGMTISESYKEVMTMNKYIDRATGKVVLSSNVLSEVTHLPFGKVVADILPALGKTVLVASMWDTIESAFQVSAGNEADALAPFKNATIASASAISAALIAAINPGFWVGAAGLGVGALVGLAVADFWDQLPAAIQQAKALGQSLTEFMDALGATIAEKISDFLEATGQAASDLWDGVGELYADLMDAAGVLVQENVTVAGHLMLDVADLFGIAVNTGSPLVLDLEGNGLNLVAPDSADAVYWDIDANGFREASGWVGAGMGLLAIDLDQNGTIDNNSELFGNQPQNGLANGFQTLAAYDSNQDGVIDSDDAQFGDLLVWVDANGDGISQEGELHSLASLDITSINLSYTNVNYVVNGNTVKQESSFVMDGQSRLIADVWFSYSTLNTIYDQDYELSFDLMNLPMQRGYGAVASLHIAMSENEDLLDMVAALATKSASDLFASNFDLRETLTDIMYEWAGVAEMDPESRGTALDARMISFLEKLNGFYFGNDPESVVAGIAGAQMQAAWNSAFTLVATHFLAQSGMKDLLGNPFYDLRTDSLSGGYFGEDLAIRFTTPFASGYWLLNDSGFNDVYVFRAGDTPHSFGLNIYETINTTTDAVFLGGIDPANVRLWTDNYGGLFVRYTDDDSFTISASKDGSGASRVGEYVEFIMFDDGTTWDLREGLNLWNIDSRSAAIFGSVFGDVIKGGSGSEQLWGYAGDDTLIGNSGDDQLSGGTGNDTYIFKAGDGLDTINEYASEGTDTIRLEGISTGDVYMWNTVLYGTYAQLVIQYGATDKIAIANGSYNSTSGATVGHVEQIIFDDNTVWDLTGGLHMRLPNGSTTAFGTAYDDTIVGGSGNDYIEGGAGNDTLIGGSGSDNLVGGAGDDFLSGGFGSDYLSGGAGADTFHFDTTALDGLIDTIADFTLAQDDVIDIRDLLEGAYDPLTDNLADFVKFETFGYSGLRLNVDLDGLGTGHGWTPIANMSGHTSLPDVDTLVANGHLLAA
ncbi:MAG: type I secretion C-terminal target domain-containing protein [Sandarakinorhabdus sp.]|nr:type I secretion C-terminal target domain-containing protein [Sandarakinorhabdus sp.]